MVPNDSRTWFIQANNERFVGGGRGRGGAGVGVGGGRGLETVGGGEPVGGRGGEEH